MPIWSRDDQFDLQVHLFGDDGLHNLLEGLDLLVEAIVLLHPDLVVAQLLEELSAIGWQDAVSVGPDHQPQRGLLHLFQLPHILQQRIHQVPNLGGCLVALRQIHRGEVRVKSAEDVLVVGVQNLHERHELVDPNLLHVLGYEVGLYDQVRELAKGVPAGLDAHYPAQLLLGLELLADSDWQLQHRLQLHLGRYAVVHQLEVRYHELAYVGCQCTFCGVLVILGNVPFEKAPIVDRGPLEFPEESSSVLVLEYFVLDGGDLAAEEFLIIAHILQQQGDVLHVLLYCAGKTEELFDSLHDFVVLVLELERLVLIEVAEGVIVPEKEIKFFLEVLGESLAVGKVEAGGEIASHPLEGMDGIVADDLASLSVGFACGLFQDEHSDFDVDVDELVDEANEAEEESLQGSDRVAVLLVKLGLEPGQKLIEFHLHQCHYYSLSADAQYRGFSTKGLAKGIGPELKSLPMPFYLKNYITPDGEQAIRNFKYKGGSSAYSYDYLWSPLAQYLLRYIPIRWAPNAITLAGFILVIIASFSIYFFGDLGDFVSASQQVFFAVCIFSYQTLDNIDGKQARRTGTSTPLGMLFDHGCDSMSCFLLSVALSRVFMVTNEKLLLYGIFLGVQLIFYMSVWAQYHSNGIMHLGKVNAVDDGIPLIWVLALFTSVVGCRWWTETAPFGIERGVMLFYFIFVSALLQTLSLVFNTGKEFTKDVRGAMKHFLHILCLTCSLGMITELTDWWKVDRYYHQIMFSLGIMYVRNTTYMQLCVTTNQPYNQFTTANFVFSVGYPAYILSHMILGYDLIPEYLFINGMLVFFILNYIHFAVSIVYHMSLILGIRPFSIRPQLLKKNMIDEKGNDIRPSQKPL